MRELIHGIYSTISKEKITVLEQLHVLQVSIGHHDTVLIPNA